MRSYGPNPLTVVISLLALCALLGYFLLRTFQPSAAMPVDCPTLLREADYPSIIALPPGQQNIPSVQLNPSLDANQPLAFVQVENQTNSRHSLDVYLYGCSMQETIQRLTPTLTPLFQQHDLLQGTASITSAHTLSIGELDPTLTENIRILMQPWQQMLYHEYRWLNNGFVQIPFPSVYPVLSRAEGEQLQQQANDGTQLPWSDPLTTVSTMAQQLLHWPTASTHIVVRDQSDTTAHVTLTLDESTLGLDVTLQRLIQSDQNGIWFVTTAASPGLNLDQSSLNAPISSPMVINGKLTTSQSKLIPSARLFDHTLTRLAVLNADALTLQSNGDFHGTLHYTNDLPGQPSLLLLSFTPPGEDSSPNALLLTNVLLS
ncbi:hypothetical protein [Ktedonospora formicarum]|uniref:Bacterial spore germination immunoglobulin-like domain-containing protein n=1 Tax=Ktedonospora formicarum TaxID=2778364 RepID=A0A8J3I0K5_9CHLR|nr:hypothetical protein [Ktedonospora formicarum]GHO42684.1 hypothetical protein KSX_08470 [Ktedonospora formicarum]